MGLGNFELLQWEASMLITRECDYAVRVIRALSDEERLSVNDICEREEITAPFAYKILKKLQKAKIVRGYRGVHGGYSLKRNVSELTLLDVYQAIDSGMYIIECINPKKKCCRDEKLEGGCEVHQELVRIQTNLQRMLSEKTLQEILGVKDPKVIKG